MFEFVVETSASPSILAVVEELALAAEAVSEARADARLVGAIILPSDETS